jgi:nucleotide-binding universal stress UspA family protein
MLNQAKTEDRSRRVDGIVVGVDGSPGALTALRWALCEGSLRSLPVTVVHAGGPDAVSPPVGWTDDETSGYDTGAFLADLVQTAQTQGWADGVDVRTAALEGRAAEALNQAARGADQLVVGSRGAGGFSRLMLGSISDHALHYSRATVTVVPAGFRVTGAGPVVVGVDGSPASRAALAHAAREARARHTRLRVVRVRIPLRVDPGPGISAGSANPLGTIERASHDLLRREIHTVLGEEGSREVDAEVHMGRPAAALLAAAEDAALLVVGSRGRGSFTGLLLGSVSSQCIHHAGCPTTVVREK